jgi:hypothetical protein
MKQIVEFRIGYDERLFGPNDNIEEILEFLKKAGTGKKVSVRIIIDD